MVAVQGDTAVAVGGAGKEGMGELFREHLLGRAPALRGPQDLNRDGRETLSGEQALMRGRIIGVNEDLMALLQVAWGAG